MKKKTSKKSAAAIVSPNGGFTLASSTSAGLDSYIAAKEAVSSQFLQAGANQPLLALAAAASPTPKDNLVGVGLGEKVTGGKYTGLMAVKLLVRIKYTDSQLSDSDRLPEDINGVPTDVEEVGTFRALQAPALAAAAAVNPRTLIRPAPPGCSIGFLDPANKIIMAGTFGALVKRGQKRFALSNNHVLADENSLPLSSPIFQPGFLDAGNPPVNGQIAHLSAFTQLQVNGPNIVDCAIAEIPDQTLVTNSILMIGPPKGQAVAQMDMMVHKFGRTSGYTAGRITSVNTDVVVNYNLGTLFFKGQVIIAGIDGQSFSAAGDSGSLIVERGTGRAVGLLFAGSPVRTIANHIGDVLQALNVTLT
jgi:hypothetical protein